MSCLEYRDYCQNFKTVSKLGNGNCACVVKVQHIKSKKQYALKYSKLDSMDKLITAFQQIEVAIALKHPIAIEIYYYFVKSAHQNLGQFGTQKFQFGILMEMADRSFQQDIQVRRKKNQYYKQQQIQQIAHQLISFFSHAQKKDYIHRDIKPANILIMPECPGTSSTPRSKYRVCDFGFAIRNHQFSSKNIAGTACYASPKIQNKFRNNQLYIMGNNFKDDVYSLGITLLQLCTLQSAQDVQPGRLLLKVNTLYGLKFSNMLQSMLKFQQQKRPDFIQLSEHCQRYFIAYNSYSLSNIAQNTRKSQQYNGKSSDIANLNRSYFLGWNQKVQKQVEICRNQNKLVVQQQKIQFEPKTAQQLDFGSNYKNQNMQEQQARLSICRKEGKDKNLMQSQQKEVAIAKTDRKKQQDFTLKYKQINQNKSTNDSSVKTGQHKMIESRLNDKKQQRYQLGQSKENTDKIKTKRRSQLMNNQGEQMSRQNNVLQNIAKAYNKYLQKQASTQQKQKPKMQLMRTAQKEESVGSNMRQILNMGRMIASYRQQQQLSEQCSSQVIQSQFQLSQQSQIMHPNTGITCALYIPAISISENGNNIIDSNIINRNNSNSCSMILMGGMNILHMYCEWHGSKNTSSMTIILNAQYIIQHVQHTNAIISCMCSNNIKINISIAPIMHQLKQGSNQTIPIPIHMQFRQCQLPQSAVTIVPCSLELTDCNRNRCKQIMMGLVAKPNYMRVQLMQQYVYTLQFNGVIHKYKQKSSQERIMVGMFQTNITIIASHFQRIYQPDHLFKNNTNANYKLQIWVVLATGSYLVLDQNLKLIRSCQVSPNCLNACNFNPSCQQTTTQLQPNHKDNIDKLVSKYQNYNQKTKSVSFLTIDCHGNVFNQKGSLVCKTQIKNAIWVCWKDSENKLDGSGKQLMVMTQNGMVYVTKQRIKQDRQSCQLQPNPTMKIDKQKQITQNNGKYTNKYIQIVQNIRRNSHSGTDNSDKTKHFLSLQHKPSQEQNFPQQKQKL